MRILLASAALTEVRWAIDHGLCDGVVIPLAALGRDRSEEVRELLVDICRASTFPVHVSVSTVTPREMHREGRALGKIADNLVVQLPLVDDAVVAMRKLATEGVRVGATLVFSAAQALLAAKAGARTVTIPLDQLDQLGSGARPVVEQMRALFDRGGVECDVVTAFPRSPAEFTECGLAGADAVTLDLPTLRHFLVHPQTDRGVDALLRDLSARRRPRIATV
jgi:transaldolase